jgi:hypothetical protein
MQEKKYEEIGTNYRFFLSWRHAAFAGDLIILYGVITLTLSFYTDADSKALAWIVPALASPIGIFLWIIDVRTRDLYHAAIRAGKVLEGGKGGFYTELANNVALPAGTSPFKKPTQSAALDLLFIGSSVISFIASILLFVATR